jgi:hypothetical protein
VDDFIDFLRTGAIHGLRVGATKADVCAVMGAPDEASITRPLIWRYGQTEITFRNNEVAMIAVRVEAEATAVRKLLDDAGLRSEPHSGLTYDAQAGFVVAPSGVTLTLDLERPAARAFAT